MYKERVIAKSILIILIYTFVSCSDDDERPLPTTPAKVFSVNTDISFQTITGFGGCNSVFRGQTNFPSETDMQKAYGIGDDELGLSIFRVSIPTNSNNWSAIANVASMAINRNAIVFASPWDAPDSMLEDPTSNEPRILPSKYGEYVDHLNSFDTYMSSNGVDLYAISMQNEPDIGEWTKWSTVEVFNFVKNHGHNINNKLITAESFEFNRSYYDQILQDDQAKANIEIVGGHIYGNGLGTIPLAEAANKEIWMTEYLLNEYTDDISANSWVALTEDQKWDQSIDMLKTIHEAMISNWNAYIWWYLKRYYSFIGDGQEGSTNGEILKRGWAFSHFSKFIRPGFVRVDVTNEDDTDLKVTAYESNSQIVIVVINDSSTTLTKTQFNLPSLNSVVAYQTSLDKSREVVPITQNTDNVEFSLVPKKSITTIVIEK